MFRWPAVLVIAILIPRESGRAEIVFQSVLLDAMADHSER